MRGMGDFERAQTRDTDPRVHELFNHLRQAIDVLEQVIIHPYRPTRAEAAKDMSVEKASHTPPVPAEDQKLSYTIKEVRKLVGISHSALYRAIGNRGLRAVKFGHRTLILAKDLREWLDSLPVAR